MKNVTHHKKREKTKSKNRLNQGDLHKSVRSIEIYLKNIFPKNNPDSRRRSFIKSKIINAMFF